MTPQDEMNALLQALGHNSVMAENVREEREQIMTEIRALQRRASRATRPPGSPQAVAQGDGAHE